LAIDYLYWYGALGAMRETPSDEAAAPASLDARPASGRVGQA
jgi:hypothetical protein